MTKTSFSSKSSKFGPYGDIFVLVWGFTFIILKIFRPCLSVKTSAVARCQILGGHTVNRDVGYGVHSYINLKILGGHVPVCPPYEYGPAYRHKRLNLNGQRYTPF